jgi:hypothetical protein
MPPLSMAWTPRDAIVVTGVFKNAISCQVCQSDGPCAAIPIAWFSTAIPIAWFWVCHNQCYAQQARIETRKALVQAVRYASLPWQCPPLSHNIPTAGHRSNILQQPDKL